MFEFILQQQGGRLFEGVAFADGTEIEHRAYGGELHGRVIGVKPNLRPSTLGADGLQFILGWLGTRIFHEPPATHERSERNVKGALGLFPQCGAMFQ